jgi:predicted RNA-binding protein YlxR (DUF448 family)
MAKTKTVAKPLGRGAWEATLRNARASQKRLDKVDRKVQAQMKLLDNLLARVEQLEDSCVALTKAIAGGSSNLSPTS